MWKTVKDLQAGLTCHHSTPNDTHDEACCCWLPSETDDENVDVFEPLFHKLFNRDDAPVAILAHQLVSQCDTIDELKNVYLDRVYEVLGCNSEKRKQALGLTLDETNAIFGQLPQINRFSTTLLQKLEIISLVRLQPRLAGEVVEDIALARRLANDGWSVGFLDAADLLTVRMFESLGDAWTGWGRSPKGKTRR